MLSLSWKPKLINFTFSFSMCSVNEVDVWQIWRKGSFITRVLQDGSVPSLKRVRSGQGWRWLSAGDEIDRFHHAVAGLPSFILFGRYSGTILWHLQILQRYIVFLLLTYKINKLISCAASVISLYHIILHRLSYARNRAHILLRQGTCIVCLNSCTAIHVHNIQVIHVRSKSADNVLDMSIVV